MFLGEPQPPRTTTPAGRLRWLGAGAAFVCAATATQAWIEVAFPRLWGEQLPLRGYDLPAGVTCLAASAFALLLLALESRSPESRTAVQPGLLVTAILAAAAMLYQWLHGPGDVRGVSGAFTAWFGAGAAAALVAAGAVVARYRALRRAGMV